MSEIKLLPCPFCGGEAYLYEDEIQDAYVVGCKNCCDIEPISRVYESKEEAVRHWNTRKPMQEIVERLEKKINPLHNVNWNSAIDEAIEIVKEVGGIDG